MSASFRLQYPRAAAVVGRETINPWTLIDDKKEFLETWLSIQWFPFLARIFMFHYTTRLPALGSEERAAKYKTVGATATAFVTDQEQTRDVEAGFLRGNLGPESAIRKWFKIENANLIWGFAAQTEVWGPLKIVFSNPATAIAEELRPIKLKLTAKDAIGLFLEVDGKKPMV